VQAIIQEDISSVEYPGLVCMDGQEAKKCLQMNANKTAIIWFDHDSEKYFKSDKPHNYPFGSTGRCG
jgi:hypothetical protein